MDELTPYSLTDSQKAKLLSLRKKIMLKGLVLGMKFSLMLFIGLITINLISILLLNGSLGFSFMGSFVTSIFMFRYLHNSLESLREFTQKEVKEILNE